MRNLKILGLALVAMLAMSAVAASMASADTFTAEKYPVTITGDQDGQTDVFTTTAGTVSCKKATYVGTVAAASKEASATPTYSECTGLGFPVTIDTNGCSYKFTMTDVVTDASTTARVDIVCPGTEEITVTAKSGATTKCIIHIPPQTTLSHVELSNIGTGTTREITGNITISGIKYTHTAGTGVGACTGGSASNGSYAGRVRLTGEETVSPFNHIGIFLS